MSLPKPHPGLVIRYSYLWKHEAEAGHEDGNKDRPCAIVIAIDEGDEVVVLPVTHAAPSDPRDAVEIPRETKARLGLDDDRSWIVISEANVFAWPGPDVRPLENKSFAYGVLPSRFFAHLRQAFLARIASEAIMRRTE